MLGALAALFGAGLASLVLSKISRAKALILFSILKVISLTGFVWLAFLHDQGQSIQPKWIYLINAFEDMFAAMLLVVILTLVMQYSRKEYAATDFTFQVSLMATVSGVLYTLSGFAGDYLGYFNYLLVITVVAIFTLVPIYEWVRIEKVKK